MTSGDCGGEGAREAEGGGEGAPRPTEWHSRAIPKLVRAALPSGRRAGRTQARQGERLDMAKARVATLRRVGLTVPTSDLQGATAAPTQVTRKAVGDVAVAPSSSRPRPWVHPAVPSARLPAPGASRLTPPFPTYGLMEAGDIPPDR